MQTDGVIPRNLATILLWECTKAYLILKILLICPVSSGNPQQCSDIIVFRLLLFDRINTRNLLHVARLCIWTPMNVLSVQTRLKKPSFTYFGTALLPISCWNLIIPNKKQGISAYDEIKLAFLVFPSDLAQDIIIMVVGAYVVCEMTSSLEMSLLTLRAGNSISRKGST